VRKRPSGKVMLALILALAEDEKEETGIWAEK
jgi:hypothetical protein